MLSMIDYIEEKEGKLKKHFKKHGKKYALGAGLVGGAALGQVLAKPFIKDKGKETMSKIFNKAALEKAYADAKKL